MPVDMPEHLKRLHENPLYFAKELPTDALASIRQELVAVLQAASKTQAQDIAKLNERLLAALGSSLAFFSNLRQLQRDSTAFNLDPVVSKRLTCQLNAALEMPVGKARAIRLAKLDEALTIHIDSNPLNHGRLQRLLPKPSNDVLSSATRRLRDLYVALDEAMSLRATAGRAAIMRNLDLAARQAGVRKEVGQLRESTS